MFWFFYKEQSLDSNAKFNLVYNTNTFLQTTCGAIELMFITLMWKLAKMNPAMPSSEAMSEIAEKRDAFISQLQQLVGDESENIKFTVSAILLTFCVYYNLFFVFQKVGTSR